MPIEINSGLYLRWTGERFGEGIREKCEKQLGARPEIDFDGYISILNRVLHNLDKPQAMGVLDESPAK